MNFESRHGRGTTASDRDDTSLGNWWKMEYCQRCSSGNEPWLIAYWHFDEGAGTIAHDASTLHNDATLEFGPRWVPSGVTLSCP